MFVHSQVKIPVGEIDGSGRFRYIMFPDKFKEWEEKITENVGKHGNFVISVTCVNSDCAYVAILPGVSDEDSPTNRSIVDGRQLVEVEQALGFAIGLPTLRELRQAVDLAIQELERRDGF